MKKDANNNKLIDLFSCNIVKLLKNPDLYDKVAVAVSGGSDSMCLLFLCKNYFDKFGIKTIALIVNHNIRNDSLSEAVSVFEYLQQKGIDSYILNRKKTEKNTKIQEQARKDRYKILIDFCNENCIKLLAVGHHLDDDVETYIMRGMYSDSFIGNAGISAKINMENVLIIRPLLNIRKNDLISYIHCNNIFYVNDPSNKNNKFLRVKIRNNIENISNLDFRNIVNNIKINYLNRKILEHMMQKIIDEKLILEKFASIKIDKFIFLNLHDDIKIMIIYNILNVISNKNYFNLKSIKNFILNIYKSKMDYSYSVGNVLIIVTKNELVFVKEFRDLNSINKFFGEIFAKFFDESIGFIKQNNNKTVEILYNNSDCNKFLTNNGILKKQIFMIPYVYDKNGLNIDKTVNFYEKILNYKFYNWRLNDFFKI